MAAENNERGQSRHELAEDARVYYENKTIAWLSECVEAERQKVATLTEALTNIVDWLDRHEASVHGFEGEALCQIIRKVAEAALSPTSGEQGGSDA